MNTFATETQIEMIRESLGDEWAESTRIAHEKAREDERRGAEQSARMAELPYESVSSDELLARAAEDTIELLDMCREDFGLSGMEINLDQDVRLINPRVWDSIDLFSKKHNGTFDSRTGISYVKNHFDPQLKIIVASGISHELTHKSHEDMAVCEVYPRLEEGLTEDISRKIVDSMAVCEVYPRLEEGLTEDISRKIVDSVVIPKVIGYDSMPMFRAVREEREMHFRNYGMKIKGLFPRGYDFLPLNGRYLFLPYIREVRAVREIMAANPADYANLQRAAFTGDVALATSTFSKLMSSELTRENALVLMEDPDAETNFTEVSR